MREKDLIIYIKIIDLMNLKELQLFWTENFDSKVPNLSQLFLRKQTAFKLQENFYGSHSELIKLQVHSIGFSNPTTYNSKGYEVGSTFSRVWKGVLYKIIVTETGFSMNGKAYRSLSGAAFHITGTQWCGKTFWRVK